MRPITTFVLALNLGLSGLALIMGWVPLNLMLVGWYARQSVQESRDSARRLG